MSKRGAGAPCWLIGTSSILLLWPGSALPAQSGTEQMLRACRAETTMRLNIDDKDVVAQPSDMPQQGEGGPRIKWFTAGGAQGECTFENDRLASWTVTRKGRRFDAEAACAAAVAKQQRVRPEDVEIVDVEKRSQTSSTLLWTTYQGETGKCVTKQNRIESVEKD